MKTFGKSDAMCGGRKYVTSDTDMEAALLKMFSLKQNGIKSPQIDISRVWPTRKMLKTSDKKSLLSKLKSIRVLLMETYNYFKLNPPQPEASNYKVGFSIIDNYHRIKKQVKIVQKYLGENSENSRLPYCKHLPRIYVIAREIVSRTDGYFDIETLINCLNQFQSKINLNLEEIWTIPVMLKLVIIEDIALISFLTVINSIISKHLDSIAPKTLVEFFKIVKRDDFPKMEDEFLYKIIDEIDQNLGNYNLDFAFPWHGRHINESFSNSDSDIIPFIKTLTLLSTLDWDQIGFVENLSIIDNIFEKSTDYFERLDRTTKNQYRFVVHQIERNSLLTEEEIAKLVVNLAEKYGNSGINSETPSDPHKSDIGYYLIDKGFPLLQKISRMEVSVYQKIRQYFRPSIFHYVGSIFFLSCCLSFLVSNCFDFNFDFDFPNNGLHLLALVSTFLLSTQWANEIVNFLAFKLIPTNLLPRFDFTKTGIPNEFRTIVVIPCLISNLESINSLISKLELRFIGNQDENLDFALLTDFEDSNQEILVADQSLLDHLKSKILRLNATYSKARNNNRSIFYAFHRPRVFNPADNIWMGYERKRGKLAAFTNLLKGIETEKFNFIVGDISKLENYKYVITLDTDTSLHKESARKLVGTMSHPLNRPVLSKSHQSIDRGFGILQPRITLNLPSSNASFFSKIFSKSYIGLDPYSRTVSNVYQDLFGESSFIGKGIYDVDVFQKILTGKFQENRILSHDLLEGNYMRTGFVGDIQLYEDFPQTYVCDLVRRHRWIRGDWQNGNYIADGNFSVLSKWKIFDNLRRSLIPLAELLLFLIYWQSWPVLCLLGMRVAFSFDVLSFPKLFLKFNPKSKFLLEFPDKNDLTEFLTQFRDNLLLFLFQFSCLPNEAYHTFDAIIRTIFRLLVSKKSLLEWTASGSLNINSGLYLRNILRKMWPGILLSIVIIVSMKTESALLPILFSWGLSPLFAWGLSQSLKTQPKKSQLSSADISFLRRIARKTWSYFEQFNTAEENYLPPDNYREFPNEQIAHRTSPTNIGLAVLSNLTAFDFGYLSCTEMVQRISNTFRTLGKLETYRGHFYNWYDTRTTEKMSAEYVSTVDSGNLAGSLLALRQGLLKIPNGKIISNQVFEGLLDTFRLSFEELELSYSNDGLKLQSSLENAIKNQPSLPETYQLLQNIQNICSNISTNFEDSNQKYFWFKKFETQVVAALDDLLKFAPWIRLNKTPEEFQCFWNNLNSSVTLQGIAEYPLTIHTQFENFNSAVHSTTSKVENKIWLENLKDALNLARKNALHMIHSLEELAQTCDHLVDRMEFDFLYDNQRRLLRIGYSVEKDRPDDSCYDLLASEARLGIFVAIAKGKLPLETWFQLGRKLTKKSKVLQSWTGSMFEYLMPQLIMPSYENTQLSRTYQEIVKIQMKYGQANLIPWGISESACALWVEHDYFYRAAGMKELSLDPKLENSFVIAPYATMLALMVYPKEACLNLKEMSVGELEGDYGFYEAGDFTSTSLDASGGELKKIVGTYMAHHQAMSFLALENVLLNEPMQRRFEEDPYVQSCLILLK